MYTLYKCMKRRHACIIIISGRVIIESGKFCSRSLLENKRG